ncbi:N-acetyltransferase [Clostridiaceae bacterium M8S5]|nr:N-acetyltransferase [Clostridiaceae bacterium M8S5]
MNIKIRKENNMDYASVKEVIKSAFYRESIDLTFNEWTLVENIRNSTSYINELSLVAVIENEIVGHILFTPLKIHSYSDIHDSLALAPVSVHKQYQNMGIGKLLVEEGISTAKKLGYNSIIVMGHPNYYMKFGFELASIYGIGINNNLDSKYLFALELSKNSLMNVNGNIKYCKEFYNKKGELL